MSFDYTHYGAYMCLGCPFEWDCRDIEDWEENEGKMLPDHCPYRPRRNREGER